MLLRTPNVVVTELLLSDWLSIVLVCTDTVVMALVAVTASDIVLMKSIVSPTTGYLHTFESTSN